MSKTSFSTLNRWLGRKNKEKSLANGKLSKSSNNLSISTNTINDTSQLEYNRITPLPVATSNAPFEQTFRITVLLPKDQLYVTRLGARVSLSKLLELVCDNKSLDPEKYEFRNPVDPSQIYNCELTIGAVGLSEIRLCHKSESYDTFNADEIIKLHRTSIMRDSLSSSSEFSSRMSKHTTKTTSPYSSSNSLNSMDSSGLNYTRTPVIAPVTFRTSAAAAATTKLTAPPRKKRAAPRPPSQCVIPEKTPLNRITDENYSERRTSQTESISLRSDINGNKCNGHQPMEEEDDEKIYESIDSTSNGYTDDTVLYAQVQKKNALNRFQLENQRNSNGSDLMDGTCKLPEPSPRKRIVQIKKKSAPAPPPRNSSIYQEDNISLASTNATSTPTTPITSSRSLENFLETSYSKVQNIPKPLESETNKSQTSLDTLTSEKSTDSHVRRSEAETDSCKTPKPIPRMTTTTLLNVTDVETDLRNLDMESNAITKNVSKVILNRTPTPEPHSLSSDVAEEDSCYESHIDRSKNRNIDDDNVSKQADSGIGEPVPSPLPDSLPSEVSTAECKSNFESSSDDDDMVKVYNFKLGKTLVKPLAETTSSEELTIIKDSIENVNETEDVKSVPQLPQVDTASKPSSGASSWTFSIPISPPPTFADGKFSHAMNEEQASDTPITPKITERPLLDFENLQKDENAAVCKSETGSLAKEDNKSNERLQESHENVPNDNETIKLENGLRNSKSNKQLVLNLKNQTSGTNRKEMNIFEDKPTEIVRKEEDANLAKSPTAPLNGLLEELSSIIQGKGVDSLMRNRNYEKLEIEAAKPNTLDNFSITNITAQNIQKPKEIPEDCKPTLEEEKLYRKRGSISSLKQSRSISRADSFHSTVSTLIPDGSSLHSRSSSQLALNKVEINLNQRRSSSELSIAESPSLQSLEVIKTILRNHKNNKNSSKSNEHAKEEIVKAHRPSQELKFTSLELKPKIVLEKDQKKTAEETPKALPKTYRYSGPPSVNVGTWNERPKVQVAIKNEGDYIFGGQKPGTFRTSLAAFKVQDSKMTAPPAVALKPKRNTLSRLGVPEQDFKLNNITVKPLRDVIHDTYVNQACSKDKRPTIEAVLRPQTQTIINTCTLPRDHKRFSTPALTNSTVPRSTSIKRIDKRIDSTEEAKPIFAPFGQNTLRRTGLKEKFLAKEEEQQQQQHQGSNSANEVVSSMNSEIKYQENFTFPSVASAKIHINLRKNTALPSTEIVKKETAPFHIPAVPKPPPIMALKPIQLKPMKSERTATPSSEPRDQLLEAIRNFNKIQLKKS